MRDSTKTLGAYQTQLQRRILDSSSPITQERVQASSFSPSLSPSPSPSLLSSGLVSLIVDTIDARLAPLVAASEYLISESLDPWHRIERSSKTTNPDRTNKVKNFYGIQEKLYCQVLGHVEKDPHQTDDHQPTVKNAHI